MHIALANKEDDAKTQNHVTEKVLTRKPDKKSVDLRTFAEVKISIRFPPQTKPRK